MPGRHGRGVHWPEVNPVLGSGRHLHRRLIFSSVHERNIQISNPSPDDTRRDRLKPPGPLFPRGFANPPFDESNPPIPEAATAAHPRQWYISPRLASLPKYPPPPPLADLLTNHLPPAGLPRHNPSRPHRLARPRPRLHRSLQASRRLVAIPARASQGGHQPDRGARVGGDGHDARGSVQDPQRQAAAGRAGQHGGCHGALQAAV